MTKYLFIIVLTGFSHLCIAQNQLSQQTQLEVHLGVVLPFLQSGRELMQSQDIRTKGQSYFAGTREGNGRNVGNYPRLSGFSLGIGFYKPVKKLKGFMMGAVVRNSQTGSQPSEGGYEEGYFFNFVTAGVAFKYYPFQQNNFFAKADAGMAAVLTKNRFRNEAGEQNFFHQFGIGTGGCLGAGYSFTPLKNKLVTIDLQAIYQQLSTRVEVNGIGNDQWNFGALHLGLALTF
jgi:hypothetical protein